MANRSMAERRGSRAMFKAAGLGLSWLLPLALAALLSGCGKPTGMDAAPLVLKGVDLSGANYARELALPDQDGRMRSLAEFKGKVLVLFFGYTQCPEVCPTTMAELAQVKKSLGPQGDSVQGIFVTLDPERDTPEILKRYVANFDPTFVALHGTPAQTQAAAKEFKVYYAKVPGKTAGSYTLDHTAASFVFDKQGRVRVFERYGADPQDVAADLKALINE